MRCELRLMYAVLHTTFAVEGLDVCGVREQPRLQLQPVTVVVRIVCQHEVTPAVALQQGKEGLAQLCYLRVGERGCCWRGCKRTAMLLRSMLEYSRVLSNANEGAAYSTIGTCKY
jgi:hypothetical protein